MRARSFFALITATLLLGTGCRKAPDANASKLPEITPPPGQVASPAPPPPVASVPSSPAPPISGAAKSEANELSAAEKQQVFNDANQIFRDMNSKDPATRARAQVAIDKMTPAQRQEYEKLRRYYLGK